MEKAARSHATQGWYEARLLHSSVSVPIVCLARCRSCRSARMRLGWIGDQVWSWRYPTFDCLWVQVTFNDDGSLRDCGGYGIDPRRDAPSDRVGARRWASSTFCPAASRMATSRLPTSADRMIIDFCDGLLAPRSYAWPASLDPQESFAADNCSRSLIQRLTRTSHAVVNDCGRREPHRNRRHHQPTGPVIEPARSGSAPLPGCRVCRRGRQRWPRPWRAQR